MGLTLAYSERKAAARLTALFEQCRLLHQTAYPSSSVDFDRLNLTGRLIQGRWAHARGHFSDVYMGVIGDAEGTEVAIKTLRLPAYTPYDDKTYKDTVLRFFREFNLWSQLDHINIAPMCGYSLADGAISLVSLWHDNGNLVEYIHAKRGVSKHDLALDVAEGILYLHSLASPLVHGDLKGANVLINEHGIACITDFGLSKQIDDMNRRTGFTTTSGVTGTLPFTAPELNEGGKFELPCDVYSYAGVVLQIYCAGRVPFDYSDNSFRTIQAKSRGEIPQRIQYPEMSGQDELWQLMSECWAYDPVKRPTIDTIVRQLYQQFRVGPRVSRSNPLRTLLDSDGARKLHAIPCQQNLENSDNGSLRQCFPGEAPVAYDSDHDTTLTTGQTQKQPHIHPPSSQSRLTSPRSGPHTTGSQSNKVAGHSGADSSEVEGSQVPQPKEQPQDNVQESRLISGDLVVTAMNLAGFSGRTPGSLTTGEWFRVGHAMGSIQEMELQIPATAGKIGNPSLGSLISTLESVIEEDAEGGPGVHFAAPILGKRQLDVDVSQQEGQEPTSEGVSNTISTRAKRAMVLSDTEPSYLQPSHPMHKKLRRMGRAIR